MASNSEVIKFLEKHLEDLQHDLDGCEADYSRMVKLLKAMRTTVYEQPIGCWWGAIDAALNGE